VKKRARSNGAKRRAFARFRKKRSIFSFGDAAGGLSLIRFFRPCERNECPRGERITSSEINTPTRQTSIRLHDKPRHAYTITIDTPTRKTPIKKRP
jgi:hypothetical protein